VRPTRAIASATVAMLIGATFGMPAAASSQHENAGPLTERASARAAGEYSTRWIGSWHCNDRGSIVPMAGARVELWQRGIDALPKFLTDDLIAVTYADDNGAYEFNTSSDGEDDFYIRVSADDNATVRLENWWEPWAWFTDTATNQNDVPVQDFGSLAIQARYFADRGSPECAIWQGVRDAYLDFESQLGFGPPGGPREVQANVPTLTPVAPYTEILWPPFRQAGPVETVSGVSFPTKRTTAHEFAHTFRHAYDGGLAHFLIDAATYAYPQTHSSCKETNSGFAFNEGWAEYWSGEFPRDTEGKLAPCAGDISKHIYEGNVALSLQALERCPDYTRADLVDTLAASPGQIHSFDEFQARLRELHGDCFDVAEPFSDARLSVEGSYGRKLFLRSVKKEIEALKQTEALLAGLRKKALDDVRDVFPCWKKGSCIELLVNQIRPDVLGGELAVTRLVRKRLSFQLDRAAVRRLGKPMTARFNKRLARKARAIRRDTAELEAKWLKRALEAARPILKRDDSLAVKTLGKRLRSSMKAFDEGRAPQGYAWPAAKLALVRTPPASPDLVIDRLYMNGDAGWRIYAEVRNIGDAPAEASVTLITQEGQSGIQVATPALEPGAVVTVSAECAYGGVAAATAFADSTGSIAEHNEGNNEAVAPLGGVGGLCRYN
jgi:hypothetical protein